ncbi:MAG: hypothetical protein JNK89_07555 [Saprospiraceae bacterium]|nr:hypothetical protein [Saprospiraceae bacterium]
MRIFNTRPMPNAELLRLLADNEIETLFETLYRQFPAQQGELALLESQWNDLRAKARAGVLSQEQVSVGEAQIRSRLKDFIESDGDERPVRRRLPVLGLALALLCGGFIAAYLFWKPAPEAVGPAAATAVDSTAAPASPTAVRQLSVPAGVIRMRGYGEGSIGYELLQAAIAPYNTTHDELLLQLRCIKPEYGKHIAPNVVHLENEGAEIAPYRIDFPFVDMNTTGEGWLYFEVPKTWTQANIVLYHGVADGIQQQKIPLPFNR